ncbi:MAG: PilZ domain-containing protein [Rhodoplanes sp.]|uniref:PilZ domain-containing protein n=1 Tax=Rhodoplanes sp. TaxID=1968906 RepID=UPI0018065EF7|nr:PilZ domain-containing protein [Rhodoplanes sp.]NVO17066.1 PilZ domain-containing protein [Rhodoplanes sp.]
MSQGKTLVDCQTSAERRRDIRVVVSLPGRYVLVRRRATHGKPPEFACRLVNISPHGMVLAGPVIGTIGEPVVGYFDEFGKLEGKVLRRLYGGFAMSLEADDDQLAKLESKLDWLDKHQRDDIPNTRQHRRIVPTSPHSTLIMADGKTVPCFVIDMSASGVAVSAEVRPPIGMPLAVGSVVGRVVRRFAEGFAVHFVEAQDPRLLEHVLIRPPARPRHVPAADPLSEIVVIDC